MNNTNTIVVKFKKKLNSRYGTQITLDIRDFVKEMEIDLSDESAIIEGQLEYTITTKQQQRDNKIDELLGADTIINDNKENE